MLTKKTILIGSSVTGLLLIISIIVLIILLTNKQPTKYTEKQCGLTANVVSFNRWRPDLKYTLSDNGKSATITPESLSSFLADFSPPQQMMTMTPEDLDAIPRTYPVIWPFENDDSYTITTDDFSFDFSPYFQFQFITEDFDKLSDPTQIIPTKVSSMTSFIYPKIICNCTKKYISVVFIPDAGDIIPFVTTINPSKCIFEMCSTGQINFRFDKNEPKKTRSSDDD